MPERLPSLFDVSGRVAIVTGGAGLLGRQYVRTLLGAGARVVVADLPAAGSVGVAAAAMKECGGETIGVDVDVTKKDSVDRMVAAAIDRWSRLDILINNAAIDPKFDAGVANQQANTFEDYPVELWEESLDVNLTGAFLCSQAAGRVMTEAHNGAIA